MTRHILIFAACFLVGAVVTAALRAAQHDAYAGHAVPVPAAPSASVDTHAAHAAAPAPAPAGAVPVNTVCAICGMTVDPAIPTAVYKGKTIGFGCRACPPKFAADPERYGPSALANQVIAE
jgi:hypothetical protein